jgi:hypothetical protein
MSSLAIQTAISVRDSLSIAGISLGLVVHYGHAQDTRMRLGL